MSTVLTVHASIEPDRIEAAQRAPRCAHIKYNGEACGCPALREKDFCRFHVDTESNTLAAPFVEDAAALQVAIMRIFRALEIDMIDTKRATAMLYALQIASSNLNRLRDELPIDPAAQQHSMFVRLMSILDPPPEKGALVAQQLQAILRLL